MAPWQLSPNRRPWCIRYKRIGNDDLAIES